MKQAFRLWKVHYLLTQDKCRQAHGKLGWFVWDPLFFVRSCDAGYFMEFQP